MYDTLVSSSVLFGTLILFIIFVALSVSFLGTLHISTAKWFFIPLMMFVAVSLIKCIRNINEIIKLKEDGVEIQTAAVVLNTCPDYWIKDTVFVDDPELEAGSDPIRLDICKNYSANKDGTVQFVGGSEMIDNFSGNVGKSIDELNNNHQEKVTQAVEEFTTDTLSTVESGSGDAIRGSLTKHLVPKYQSDHNGKSVSFQVDSSEIESTDKLTELTGEHTHIIATHPNAYNDDGVHETINGLVYHTHDFENPKEQIPREQMRDGEFMENWINVSKESHKGLEINLTKLNNSDNVCELSSPFYWTERYNECVHE